MSKKNSESNQLTSTRKRASLINTCHRTTRKTFFSKQLLVFLVTVTLLKSSGDQCSTLNGDRSYCYGTGNSILLVSAATATAPSKSDDDQKKRTGIIRGVNAQNPTVQSMRNFASGSGKRKIDVVLQQPPQASFSEILKKAGRSGIGGGIPGFIAGIVQVLTLMWLRTVMNYQCRYGASFPQAMRILYSEGGIPRFYRGMSFALVQAPLARFVATAANDGVETLLANLKLTENWGPGRSTIIASIIVGLWRMVLMPIDTCKTVLQVDSVEGFRNLMRKVKAGKIYVLYQGKADYNLCSSLLKRNVSSVSLTSWFLFALQVHSLTQPLLSLRIILGFTFIEYSQEVNCCTA